MTSGLVVTIAIDSLCDGQCVSTTLGAYATIEPNRDTPLELLHDLQTYLGVLYRPVTPQEAREALYRRQHDEAPWHQLELF